jgi:aminoglycoside 3-N-acetyltransferase I
VVEEATLERWYTGNGIVGSNPTFSALYLLLYIRSFFFQNRPQTLEFQIKKLTPSDIKTAQELFILFKKVFEEITITLDELPLTEYIKNILSKESFHVYAAISNNTVIGGITGYEFDLYMKESKEMYIYDLAVDTACRRNGIARSLIDTMTEDARQRNISTVFVEAESEDIEAVEFYKSTKAEMLLVNHFNFTLKK